MWKRGVNCQGMVKNKLLFMCFAQVGHTYINVIDIEADELQELPVKKESSADVSNQQCDHLEVPFSAELHYMATSVTNDVPVHKVKSDGNNSDVWGFVFGSSLVMFSA